MTSYHQLMSSPPQVALENDEVKSDGELFAGSLMHLLLESSKTLPHSGVRWITGGLCGAGCVELYSLITVLTKVTAIFHVFFLE